MARMDFAHRRCDDDATKAANRGLKHAGTRRNPVAARLNADRRMAPRGSDIAVRQIVLDRCAIGAPVEPSSRRREISSRYDPATSAGSPGRNP
jgi:hypothetical protein